LQLDVLHRHAPQELLTSAQFGDFKREQTSMRIPSASSSLYLLERASSAMSFIVVDPLVWLHQVSNPLYPCSSTAPQAKDATCCTAGVTYVHATDTNCCEFL